MALLGSVGILLTNFLVLVVSQESILNLVVKDTGEEFSAFSYGIGRNDIEGGLNSSQNPYPHPSVEYSTMYQLRNHEFEMNNSFSVSCPFEAQFYRTMDGYCNNLQHPCWGKAAEPYRRWLPPAYANGIDELRRRVDGGPLPHPRFIQQHLSSPFQPNENTAYPTLTALLVICGQYSAHDLVSTPVSEAKIWDGKEFKKKDLHCCGDSSFHPDCKSMIVDFKDDYYPLGYCINFTRSAAFENNPSSCAVLSGGPREQINRITSFLDASNVYGSSTEDMLLLREDNGAGAKLAMDNSSGWSVLIRGNSKCKVKQRDCDDRCFIAGDDRASTVASLGALHALWAREHNRLVDALRSRGWSEEKLYQQVRKIVGALMQHIIYSEYLPIILGPTVMKSMQLEVPTSNYQYDPSINPSIFNVFASAAYRYGHSMIPGLFRRARVSQINPFLEDDYFSMDEYCKPRTDPITQLLAGLLDQKVQGIDCLFTKQVSNKLLAKDASTPGMDIISIGIQRARDHGIAGYGKWREACGLPVPKNYSDLKGLHPDYLIENYEKVYGPNGVGELDMYLAEMTEFPHNDGLVGPTISCIVSTQFRNIKFGDRFWYENTNHPGAFTKEQIKSIQRIKLATLFCNNADIHAIQPLVFYIPSPTNPKKLCSDILRENSLDLDLWQ